MIICVLCEKEMRCKTNGVIATWHKTHRYSGDIYQCRKCGAETLVTNPTPYHATNKIEAGYEIVMDS